MKKPRTLGLTMLIIFAVLTSCTSNPADITPTQVPIATATVNLHVEYATDELLAQFVPTMSMRGLATSTTRKLPSRQILR